MLEREKWGEDTTGGRNLRAAALLFCVTLIAYFPAITGGFVWDDDGYVTKPALRSLQGLWRIWFDLHATEQYYPLLHTAFWVQHRMWGDAPLGYHLVNVLLHATAACLFGLALQRVERVAPNAWEGLRPGETPAFTSVPLFAAFLFALHPVCVESVAWISELKNTLSTVFYLSAALIYLRWRAGGEGGRPRSLYFLATALFVCAILSKSVAATLPAALLVVLWWKQGRLSWRNDVVPLTPWFVLAAAGGLVTGWVESRLMGAEGPEFAFGFMERTLIAGRAVWFYLGKLVWPADLVFIYPRWKIDAGAWWQWLFPLGVIAVAAGCFALRRRTRGPLAAFLFFVGTLFPTLGFLNVFAFIFSYVADHWQYLASLGFFTFAAGAWGRWRNAEEAFPLSRFFPILVLAALGVLTWRQCGVYRSAEALYRAILGKNPAAWMAQNNLGMILAGQGRRGEAIAHYEQAVRLRPTDAEAHNNLAILLADDGRFPEALAHYREALRIERDRPEFLNNLGNALVGMGRFPEAIGQFERALALQPDYAVACDNLGIALAGAERLPEAIAAYEHALRLQPAFPEAENHLGNAIRRTGRMEEAGAHYSRALQLKPDFPEARDNLGDVLLASGKKAAAIVQYEEAVRLKPNYPEARCSLGNLLADSGRLPEAAAQFAAASRLQPNNAEIHNNLGCVLAEMGRTADARGQFDEALRLRPDDAEARANLAHLRNVQPGP